TVRPLVGFFSVTVTRSASRGKRKIGVSPTRRPSTNTSAQGVASTESQEVFGFAACFVGRAAAGSGGGSGVGSRSGGGFGASAIGAAGGGTLFIAAPTAMPPA